MVSVVLTTYNGEKFIKEQLESIFYQYKKPDEVIIQDDLSTDKTCDIVEEFITNNNLNNWKLYKNKKNLGYIDNFNSAMEKANGEYIFLCDQDDIWDLNKINDMVKIMEENKDIRLLMSNMKPFYIEGSKNKIFIQKIGFKRIIKFKFKGYVIQTPRPGCVFAIKKDLIDIYLKYKNTEFYHDNLLWQVALILNKAYLYNRDTILYRRHNNNATKSGKNNEHTKKQRLIAVNKQIENIRYLLKINIISNEQRNFLNKQLEVYLTRYECLKNNNIIKYIKLLKNIKCFNSLRVFLVDLFFIIGNER